MHIETLVGTFLLALLYNPLNVLVGRRVLYPKTFGGLLKEPLHASIGKEDWYEIMKKELYIKNL